MGVSPTAKNFMPGKEFFHSHIDLWQEKIMLSRWEKARRLSALTVFKRGLIFAGQPNFEGPAASIIADFEEKYNT